MASSITLRFPGGVAVEAVIGEHLVKTDQPVSDGGGGTAPSPFDLFLASIAACVGFYVVRFCRQREIDTAGLEVDMSIRRDPSGRRVVSVEIEVTAPSALPAKYRSALVRAADQCTVKRHLSDPPEVRVTLSETTRTEAHRE